MSYNTVVIGTCPLCRKVNCEIRESHYVPAALYPKNLKLEMLPRVPGQAITEITMLLLCADCEERFNRRGESEVLRHIAGKIANKPNPIVAKLEPLTVHEQDETLKFVLRL